MILRIDGLVFLAPLLAPAEAQAAESRPRSIQVLDQSDDLCGPFYYQAFSRLGAEVSVEASDFLAVVQAAARNVALYCRPCPEPLRIKGDAVQLEQLNLNLVVNSMEAISAMPYGRAVIGRAEMDGASAASSMSNSGPGIPPKKLAEIFDRFFATKQQGMGIGLSIARTIVQAHRGRIWAENDPERGAVFHLSMSLATH